MQIAVIGATGRTGVPFVEQARAAGHGVAAVVRSPEKRRLLPDDVRVVEGDARDRPVLDRLVDGADVVVDVSGPAGRGEPDLRQAIVTELLAAMDEAGVARLVLLTGAGVRLPGDDPAPVDRVVGWIMERATPELLADGRAAVALARGSDREVTVVRAPRLVDGGRGGTLRVAEVVGGGHGARLGRDDLARFLLGEAQRAEHVGGAPVVSW
jgi:nucleoside-diphosphate-sugar epimerase